MGVLSNVCDSFRQITLALRVIVAFLWQFLVVSLKSKTLYISAKEVKPEKVIM